jgi:hypothetical protein
MNNLKIAEFLELTQEETEGLKSNMESMESFYLEPESGGEYRLISETAIEEIFHEEVTESLKDCYDLSSIPDFIEIDWKATTDNCLMDGYGHQFSYYDGSEELIDGYYIFRTN